MTMYSGRIVAKVPHPTGLIGRQYGWTCDHKHRSMRLAFECAVTYAQSGSLKRSRGQHSEATNAGICHMVIEATVRQEKP